MVALPVDPLLLATVSVATFDAARALTKASGFFFLRDERLFLVTSRHVFFDEANEHRPDRIEVGLHPDAGNLAKGSVLSILLYRDGHATWRQGRDAGGDVDVAVLEIERGKLPPAAAVAWFTAASLPARGEIVALGQALLIPGFPLGFHDALHRLPVVRQGVVASPYGWRFQGTGCFLTDARTHRGLSGAPVVMASPGRAPMPWLLLGVHSSRIDMSDRDDVADESLGLNAAWYSDVLLTLTGDGADHPSMAQTARSGSAPI
jgi:hypothetical protein